MIRPIAKLIAVSGMVPFTTPHSIGPAAFHITVHTLRPLSEAFTFSGLALATLTSAPKYFWEIRARVPSLRSAARAWSAWARSAGSDLRNVRAWRLMSLPALPAILTFFDPVEAR